MDSEATSQAADIPAEPETGDAAAWRDYLDHLLDDALADTFPASDPIALPAELPVEAASARTKS
ncbi:hypothetical protein IAI18_06450 [Acetobacteraceae bacterium H6797]|nr:hypothetical protein [Acetobacteraceae bacterium H6797]